MEQGPRSSSNNLGTAISKLEELCINSTSKEIRIAAGYLKSNLSDRTTQASFLELIEQLSQWLKLVNNEQEMWEFEQVINLVENMLPATVPQSSSKEILTSFHLLRASSQSSLTGSEDEQYTEAAGLLSKKTKKEKAKSCNLM